MNKKTSWLFIIGVAIGIPLVLWIAIPRLTPHTFHGTLLQSPDEAPDFTLKASNNQDVSLSDFREKVIMLYFGYSFCPDVCPATLAEVATALDILGRDTDKVQFIMISVDPGRDTPEKMSEYVAHFHPDLLGVTGDPDTIAKLTTLYGIFFEMHEGTEATGYLVDHTATITVIDQDGHVKLIFPFGLSGEDIAEDIGYLIKH
ncbi:MAG: SCO family protein [Chloroflexi bacterium]|nr:SCO family protein [Chloroflexota bacterium]